jgi:hypothetical protein
MSNSITVELKSSANGTIDQVAAQAAFDAALASYVAEFDTQASVFADAVNAVFDQHNSKPIKMDMLKSLALAKLNVQPETFSALSERLNGYIKSQKAAGTLTVAKGSGGGVSRVAQ